MFDISKYRQVFPYNFPAAAAAVAKKRNRFRKMIIIICLVAPFGENLMSLFEHASLTSNERKEHRLQ